MILSAYFANIGIPKTGLSPLITIFNLTDGTEDVSAAAMTEVGGGWYSYDFAAGSELKHYAYTVDSVVLSGPEQYAPGEWTSKASIGDIIFPAYFRETGSPKTGLSPVITVYNLTSGAIPVVAQPMVEVGGGWYKYAHSGTRKDQYSCLCDSVTLTGVEKYAAGDWVISENADVPNERDVLRGVLYDNGRRRGKLQKTSAIFKRKEKVTDDHEVFFIIKTIMERYNVVA